MSARGRAEAAPRSRESHTRSSPFTLQPTPSIARIRCNRVGSGRARTQGLWCGVLGAGRGRGGSEVRGPGVYRSPYHAFDPATIPPHPLSFAPLRARIIYTPLFPSSAHRTSLGLTRAAPATTRNSELLMKFLVVIS